MSLRDQLFGFEGRIRRTEWWVRSLLVGLVAAVVFLPFRLFLGAEGGPFDSETGFYAYLAIDFLLAAPFFWIQTALCVQRGHDLNIPAWPFIVFQILAAGSGYIPLDSLFPAGGPVTPATAAFAINSVYGIGSLIGLVVLGFLPGTHGPNRFGPSTVVEDKSVFTTPGGVE